MTGSFSTWDLVWCAYGRLRANSFSSVEQIGQTELIGEIAVAVMEAAAAAAEAGLLVRVGIILELVLAYLEWQEGVFRAERPAQRAMCKSGRWGREKRAWWVSTKRSPR